MLTILQINSACNWGSTGRIAEEIGQCAIEQGWTSYMAYGRSATPSRLNTIPIGSDWSVLWHGLITRLLDKHGLGSARATHKLIRDIEVIKPDIIHLHNIHGYYLNYKILFEYLAKAGIPVVWTLHDCWAFTGHCSHFEYVGCDKWQTHCEKCPQKNTYPNSWLLDRSATNFDLKRDCFNSVQNLTIVSVSHWLDSLVGQSFLKNNHHICIYNGVDTTTFSPQNNPDAIRAQYHIQTPKFVLGVASVWSQRKGLADFMALRKILSEKIGIVLVGLNNEQQAHLPQGIIGIPRTNNVQELAGLYSAADVVLNLSYEETFGLTTVEGMACGTPGIVYQATASPELVTHETGMVVKSGDIIGVSDAITHMLSRGKENYSPQCRQWVLSNFNKNDRYQDYINLYNSLLNK